MYFFAFLKKDTKTKSRANFVSPEPNGPGYVSTKVIIEMSHSETQLIFFKFLKKKKYF